MLGKRPARTRLLGGGAIAVVGLALVLSACLKGPSSAAAASGPLARAPDGRPLVMTFDDEFNAFRRFQGGQGVWRTTYKDGKAADEFEIRTLKGNKEVQLYVDPEFAHLGLDPFRLRNGVLEIR